MKASGFGVHAPRTCPRTLSDETPRVRESENRRPERALDHLSQEKRSAGVLFFPPRRLSFTTVGSRPVYVVRCLQASREFCPSKRSECLGPPGFLLRTFRISQTIWALVPDG